MNVTYRQAFLRDLKRIKNHDIYQKIFELAFVTLPRVESLKEISGIKALQGQTKRFRIRIGDYRIGIESAGDSVELMRVLHRRKFYRYFP